MAHRPFYYRVTDGIRVTVRPMHLPQQSRPSEGQFVFVYHVRIENVGDRTSQLMSRRWQIHDDVGEDTVVEGDGVVGKQPVIAPGRVHEYRSFCVLKSPTGFMEGAYRFVRPDGSGFEAVIPRFQLDATDGTKES